MVLAVIEPMYRVASCTDDAEAHGAALNYLLIGRFNANQ
jgi:hypothetical protein